MNEHLLVDVLTDDERLAPDLGRVRDGITGGIRRRRRRRMAGYAASAVALVLVGGALAVTVPATGERPAGTTRTLAGEWNRTLRLGYVPDGMTTPLYSASAAGEGVLYPVSREGYLRVDITTTGWTPRLDLPGWRTTQVGGRPARIVSRPKRTMIDWQLPSGRWASLEYGQGRAHDAAGQLAVERIVERVALGVTEGTPEPVRLAFGPTYLPPGTRVVGVRGVSPEGYGTIDVTAGSQRVLRTDEATTEDGISVEYPVLDDRGGFGVSFHPGSWQLDPGDRRTDDIDGRRTYLLNRETGIAVDTPPHGCVIVDTIDRPEPLAPAELRRVAKGVRWTG